MSNLMVILLAFVAYISLGFVFMSLLFRFHESFSDVNSGDFVSGLILWPAVLIIMFIMIFDKSFDVIADLFEKYLKWLKGI